jgi:hypothetical protein
MKAMVQAWRPDLVVREPSELASYVVAEASGIPHVQVAVGLADVDERFSPLLDGPLGELGSSSGVAGLRSAPRLSLLPESFEEPAATGRTAIRRYRVSAPQPGHSRNGGQGRVPRYVTFGSVAAGLGLFPSLYQQIVAEVAELPVHVLLTIGEASDPEMIGTLPVNVHVERWWPQEQVMPHAAAMVGHGGFGTTLMGLASGLPMVVVPLFADQPYNARRVEALGIGIALEGGPAAVEEIKDALQRVLSEDWYRRLARNIADEIAELPPASECVPFLEQVTGTPL